MIYPFYWNLLIEHSGEISLSDGSHENKFEFMLPYEMSTAFKGKNGQIEYTICVGLDIRCTMEMGSEIQNSVYSN